MGEAAAAAVDPPPSAFHKTTASPLRLLDLLKQPDSGQDTSPPHLLELDETDVVWSSASDGLTTNDYHDSFNLFSSPAPDLVPRSPPPSSLRPRRRPFSLERRGLSAALEEDQLPLVRQRLPASRATQPVAVPARRAGETWVVGKVGHHQSAPVAIPAWPRQRKERKAEVLDEEERWEEEELVPPHVMVARSQAMTFSVLEGAGRTLKGRDLRRVRNAVLQKTGFLDL